MIGLLCSGSQRVKPLSNLIDVLVKSLADVLINAIADELVDDL